MLDPMAFDVNAAMMITNERLKPIFALVPREIAALLAAAIDAEREAFVAAAVEVLELAGGDD